MSRASNSDPAAGGGCGRASAEGTACPAVVRAFLEDVLGAGRNGGSEIELRVLGEAVQPSSIWKASPEDILAWRRAQDIPRGAGLYFGVARRHDRDGSAAGVRELRATWVDVDAKQVPGLVAKYDPKKAIKILDALLASLRMPPTWRVYSGGGIHAYWVLREPAEPERVRRLNEGIIRVLGPAADRQAKDVARVMRLPGSINWKPEYVEAYGEAPRCEIRDYTGRTYAIEELEAAFPPAAPRPPARPIRPLAPGERRALLPCAQRILDNWPDAGSGLRHRAALVVASGCLNARISQPEAEALVEKAARAAGDNEIHDRLRAVADTYKTGITHSFECETGGVAGSCGPAEREACPIERSRRGLARANGKVNKGGNPGVVLAQAADGTGENAGPDANRTIDAKEIIAELDAIRTARDGEDRAGAQGKLDDVLRRLEAAAPLQGSAIDRDAIRRRLRGLGVGAEGLQAIFGCDDVSPANPPEMAVAPPGTFGLVEDEDGELAFLVADLNGEPQATHRLETSEKVFVPPPRKAVQELRWKPPRFSEVCEQLRNLTEIVKSLEDYFRSCAILPSVDYATLLAIWTVFTYLWEREEIAVHPMLALCGPPDRGKSRVSRSIGLVALRGWWTEAPSVAQLLRMAEDLRATVIIEAENLMRTVGDKGILDILLMRYEKGGTVPRVLWPDRPPFLDTRYFRVEGPTVVTSNKALSGPLERRTIPIPMPEAPEKAPQDGADPEVAAKLRAVLVALAFSLRDTPLPKVDRPHPGRVGDLFRPLIAIARLIAPDREAALLRVMEATAKERVAANLATSERDVLLAIWSLVKDQGLAERAKESEPGKEPQLLLGDIAARVDPDLNDEKAPKGKKAAAARRISNILRNLTLTVGRAKATNKAALVVEPSKLDPLYRRYGIASEQDVEGGA